jgi:predicted Rdx family selenoprotein
MTGGVFTITIWSAGQQTALGEASTEENILWDRKRDGGFPGMFDLIHPIAFSFFSTEFCNIYQFVPLKRT